MGYSNGQLETSSGTGQGERGEPGLPGIGFNLTDDGNFDLDSKRLTDVADPVDDGDAATKKYVDDHISSDAASKKYVDDENARQDIAINSKAERDRVLPLDGSKSMTGNLQMGSKMITGLADGSDDGDAVNYSQLISHTRNYVTHYQLVGSFRFYHRSKEITLKRIIYTKGHQAHKRNYEISGVDGTDSAGGGEAWFDLKMTNTLESGTYTVVFEIYPTIFEKGNLYHQNNEVLLQSVHGDSKFQIITFSHDWQSSSVRNIPHSKAYIQFNSNGESGTINFQIRYYGSNYADSRLTMFFFARTLKGKHDDTFNHDIFDIREGQGSNDQFLFFEDINMNDNRIYGLPQPTGPQQPATKKYVDDNALPLSGGSMKGSFSMSGNRIYNLPIPTGSQQPATKEYTEKFFLRKTGNETTDYNANSKKIVNLSDPTDDNDAANKGYVLSQVGNVDLTAYLRRDGTQSMTGNLQMGSKKITDLDDGISDGDAVNYSQLIRHTTDHNRQYQLVSSPNFFGDKGALTKSRFQIRGHLHLDLYDVGAIEGRGTPSKHEAWSSLKMSNTLERGIYTVVFEIFSTGPLKASSLTSMILNDETLLYFVHGDSHFQIITFNHGWESDSGGNTPHSKAYIQFSSDGQPGEIKFQIRYYGEVYNQSLLGFLFYSRVLRGKHTNTFDHQLFDVKETESGNAFLFFENIKMNDNQIFGLPQPTGPQQPATKKYVDDNALLLSGGNMTGSIIMQGNRIHSLPIPTGSQEPATKEYIEKYCLQKIGNETTDYNAASKKLVNLADPTDDNDAANKGYLSKIIDRKITEAEKFNIKSSTQNNAFLFVMDNDLFKEDDNDITKVGEVDKDFYQIKKATYEFTIKYDSSIKYYSVRLSIDLISLPLGEYTLVFEMYYSGKTNQNEVTVGATSGTLNVSRTNTNTFGDHSRSIINFHKYIFSSGYEDLDIDIALKNRAGESYDPNTTIYVIVYGVTGHQNEVSTLVWDSAFALENKALKLKANIDMNEHDIINVDKLSFKDYFDMEGKEIKNLGDGNENGDAVNIKQLNEYEDNLLNYISRKITEVDKNLGAQKVEFIKDLNDAICDYSFSNWKVCEFYVTDGNDYDGSLRDRKPNAPFLKLEQSDTDKQPVVVANGQAGNAYFSFNPDEWLNVNYSLKDREYISVFIVYTLFRTMTGMVKNGLWGDHNRKENSRSIHINERGISNSSVTIKSGNEVTTITSFPSKANPTSLNKIILISLHFNTKNENNSEFYCNGKQIDRFITDSLNGQNNFTVGEIGINTFPNYRKEKKRIYYFSLFHNYFFNTKDIKRMHKHLCERYSIDHDPIDIS